MSIATLNPWQVLDQLQQDALRRHSNTTTHCSTQRKWHPAVDINETKDQYEIVMDLPGTPADQVSIEVENNQLSIAGERKRTKEPQQSHHQERAIGAFSRQFKLPKDADPSQVQAAFKDGVLTVAILKQEESKPRKVAINTIR